MGGKKRDDIVFIFLFRKCAGAVHQYPPRLQTPHRIFKNTRLPAGTGTHCFFTPFTDGFRIFPEHSLTGTGRITQHGIKIALKHLRGIAGITINDYRIGCSMPLKILTQNTGAGRNEFIGNQKPRIAEGFRNLGAFGSGSRT